MTSQEQEFGASRRQQEREEYRSEGYVLLRGLFPAEILRRLHSQIREALGASQSQAFVKDSVLLTKPAIEVYSQEYPRLSAFLWGLTPCVAEIAGVELMPSYAYFRLYQQRDVCKVHFDRPACEHSLSLVLELSDAIPWPLAIGHEHRARPTTTVESDFGSESYSALPMSAGDAVMYRGVNHRHGRIDPNPNQWSAHLFMHWVDAAGPYADHAFDQVKLMGAQAS